MGHFTIFCVVTCPMNATEAGGDLVLIQIQNSLSLSFKCKIEWEQLNLHNNKQRGLFENKVTCSLAAI